MRNLLVRFANTFKVHHQGEENCGLNGRSLNVKTPILCLWKSLKRNIFCSLLITETTYIVTTVNGPSKSVNITITWCYTVSLR